MLVCSSADAVMPQRFGSVPCRFAPEYGEKAGPLNRLSGRCVPCRLVALTCVHGGDTRYALSMHAEGRVYDVFLRCGWYVKHGRAAHVPVSQICRGQVWWEVRAHEAQKDFPASRPLEAKAWMRAQTFPALVGESPP
jgi:hypothetical protein